MVLTRINNNIGALTAARSLRVAGTELTRSLERLSSGLRINRASDDAAGLAISELQRVQIRGLNRARGNAIDGVSLLNTAEGALTETTNRLQRIRELAVQAANSGGGDIAALQGIQAEIEQSIAEIGRIAQDTQFATRRLFDGGNASSASVAAGTRARGVAVAQTPLATTLSTGLHTLTIERVAAGTEYIDTAHDPDGIINSGILSPAQIGASTFANGLYRLEVSDFQPAAQRVLETREWTAAMPSAVVTSASLLTELRFAGRQLQLGDTINISGIDENGAAVSAAITVGAATTLGDLTTAINDAYDDGALDATATISGGGATGTPARLRLTSQTAGPGDTSLTLTITPAGGAPIHQDTARVVRQGNYNTANLRIDGGPTVTAVSGETITLYGQLTAATDGTPHRPQITLTLGALANGVDVLNITEQEFTASLDGGDLVRFRNGAREVFFRSGKAGPFASGELVMLNFAPQLEIPPGIGTASRAAVILSAVNRGIHFQIGANEGQGLRLELSVMRPEQLGYLEGVTLLHDPGETLPGTVDQIDVTREHGAELAIRIIDRALAQVSRQRSYLGAVSNRLESAIASLGISAESLAAAESRIRDADLAVETTAFTRNQILVQAGTAILAQANAAPRAVLELLTR